MFTGCSAPYFPKQYAQTKLWLDASNPANNNIRPSTGSNLATWVDCSSAGSNATQPSAGNRPQYDPAGCFFDEASGDFMTITSTAALCMQSGLTIIGVLRAEAGSQNTIWISKGTGGSNNEFFFFMNTDGQINFGAHNTIDETQMSGASSTDIRADYKIVMGMNNGTALSIWINGTQENSTLFSGTLKTNIGNVDLAQNAGGGNNYIGLISDVVVLNSPTPGLIKLINQYLSQKYSIPVA